jgi:perosamine synthetase
MKPIPLAGPDISAHERRAVLDVLKTPVLSRGPKLYEFEDRLSRYIGTRYAVATSSGTSALHIAVRAYGIKEGDFVITTPLSFISSANCILFERARPAFVDIKEGTYCIDADLVEAKVKELKRKKQPVKAILAVDLFGHLADWQRIKKIASQYNLKLIEDSCEALGSYKLNGKRRVMAGTFGDVGIFGFYPNKQMTTGEGGALVTNDKNIAKLARTLKNHGAPPKGHWSGYSMLGYNYHISDIQCALGTAQLSRINKILKKKIDIASIYTKRLGGSQLVKPFLTAPKGVRVSPFIYVVQLADKFSSKDRDFVMERLKARGVGSREYFPTIHLSPFYKKKFGYKRGDFPIAEHVAAHSLALPFFNSISKKQINYICDTLDDILKMM